MGAYLVLSGDRVERPRKSALPRSLRVRRWDWADPVPSSAPLPWESRSCSGIDTGLPEVWGAAVRLVIRGHGVSAPGGVGQSICAASLGSVEGVFVCDCAGSQERWAEGETSSRRQQAGGPALGLRQANYVQQTTSRRSLPYKSVDRTWWREGWSAGGVMRAMRGQTREIHKR